MGKPQSGRFARIIGPGGTGTPGRPVKFSIPNQNVMLAPLTGAFCYSTEISGAFDGVGESVTILPGSDAGGVNRGVPRARHASGGGASAKVRCYARNQIRHPAAYGFRSPWE